ncbi:MULTISPECIES: ParB/RepB/Spo0J family partition protein [Paraburkholderia]|jgi:ParB family transcriptional regulator, chromosome partitioning protein|uniref:Chromosome partitioning protein, ParB family n=1 Tax=Paraburkholderia tropica TaxID=92647 RepID=A0AAQ1GM60_9BURK|nr:ParB/RepB/Spo0J family partition protein [Paraburkholderia tropica]PXX05635.1 ParB family chromosome partitioning protein [Paraburkholderia tropica]PZW70757.1 ParB family chromosome partitioning protein [Paraburkholderia tropica]QNB17285.1 ParB/RepB/Spo0J family partition protein [Paraburkholderia tropica]RQN37302.1 ParB/RepB/Spo0J family partition protein [Paraburkholderia tropica]SEK12904.1 chromosome partitioning protein, ParB family [Paraburkholderia tropica]
MSSLRDRMMAKTADVRATKDIKLAEQSEKNKTPLTAPGMAGALAQAQQRISELEKAGLPSEVRVADIVPNPWQPRQVFSESKLTQLAESIRESGLVQPIVVRRKDAGYQLVAGERRWRAHKMIEREIIKVFVVDLSDEEMALLALVENVAREDLSDYEISRSIRRTEKEFPSRKRVAEALGISRSELYRFLSFAELPDFVIRDLDVQPRLLGAHAAQNLVSVLRDQDEKAFELAKQAWTRVVAGDLDQTKLAKAIKQAIEDDGKTDHNVSDRKIEKIFAGGNQAGSITRDSVGLTVKIRAGLLTDEKERQVRELIAQLFTGTA